MRKKFQWQSTKKRVSTNTETPSTPTQTDSQSLKWYRSINTLPLNKFIDVIVDGNYSALIISGFPSQIELQLAWADITAEYSDAIGDQEGQLYLKLFKEITILAITLQQIEMLIELLGEVYHKAFADTLNALVKTSFVFDPEDEEGYRKQLKACYNRSRSIKIDLHFKKAHFEAIQNKNESQTVKYSREYFQSVLITISDHAKYPIQDTITVFEYCTRLKRFNEYYKIMESRSHGGRS